MPDMPGIPANSAFPSPRLPAVRDLLELTKPRVTRMVLFTAVGGMGLAPGPLRIGVAVAALAGLGLVVGAANALNCWLERDVDARMARTADRPLPAGRLDPSLAVGFALVLGVLGLGLLAAVVTPLVASFSLVALVLYVCVYTPLKRVSPLALLVGAIPGASPPLLGWLCMTGSFHPGAFALFGILYWWQLPHFVAIATLRSEEYAAAGYRVLPLVQGPEGERVASLYAAFSAIVLLPLSVLPTSLGLASPICGAVVTVAGVAYVLAAAEGVFARRTGNAWSQRLFVVSLVYLPTVFVALLAGTIL